MNIKIWLVILCHLLLIFTHRKGSIIVDYTVVFDDKNNNSYVADAVVQAIMELETVGNLIIEGKPVHVKPGIPVVYYLSFSNESLPITF